VIRPDGAGKACCLADDVMVWKPALLGSRPSDNHALAVLKLRRSDTERPSHGSRRLKGVSVCRARWLYMERNPHA